MAAIFYNINPEKSLFKGGLTLISPVRLNFMEGFIGPASLAIVTRVGIQNRDTIQYFMTFDDAIHYFYFGKGMGQISISGMILSDDTGAMPGVSHYYNNVIGQNRGKSVYVSMGNITFEGVISNFTTDTTVDPEFVTQYEITLTIVNHNIPRPVSRTAMC